MGPTEVSESERRRVHWDAAYERVTPTDASWFQSEPTLSLELMQALGLSPDAPIIDIGGGASTLADALVERGFVDVSVLDVSLTALDSARDRLGERADRVQWLREDLLDWEPPRRYAVWHDRAMFHFLADPSDRERYASTLRATMAPAAVLLSLPSRRTDRSSVRDCRFLGTAPKSSPLPSAHSGSPRHGGKST